eukprot:928717_1
MMASKQVVRVEMEALPYEGCCRASIFPVMARLAASEDTADLVDEPLSAERTIHVAEILSYLCGGTEGSPGGEVSSHFVLSPTECLKPEYNPKSEESAKILVDCGGPSRIIEILNAHLNRLRKYGRSTHFMG